MTHETAVPAPASRRALFVGLGLLALAVGVFALGKLGLLPGLGDIEVWLNGLSDSPWGLPAVIAVFCVAAFLGIPQFALIAATVAVFGPVAGAAYGWIGNMVSGAVTFWVGRAGGEAAVRRYAGPRAQKLSALIGRNALIASAVVRTIPTGPFLLVNMVFGASSAKFRDYWIGMGLGILPKILMVAIGWQTLVEAYEGDPLTAILFGTAALAIYVGVAYFVVRRARRAWQDIPAATPPEVDTGQKHGD